MVNPDEANMLWDTLAVGATRPSFIQKLRVPWWSIFPILGIPLFFLFMTHNPFLFLGLIVGLALGVRVMTATDHNRPRILALSYLSGSLFADRSRWGGISVDPLGRSDV